jgi:hypothetical protein
MKARRFVAYYRVLTERQGTSGLGATTDQEGVPRQYSIGAVALDRCRAPISVQPSIQRRIEPDIPGSPGTSSAAGTQRRYPCL